MYSACFNSFKKRLAAASLDRSGPPFSPDNPLRARLASVKHIEKRGWYLAPSARDRHHVFVAPGRRSGVLRDVPPGGLAWHLHNSNTTVGFGMHSGRQAGWLGAWLPDLCSKLAGRPSGWGRLTARYLPGRLAGWQAGSPAGSPSPPFAAKVLQRCDSSEDEGHRGGVPNNPP